MKKLVFLTGAGMCMESGFENFARQRWPVGELSCRTDCNPRGWEADPTLVTNFYNMLRHEAIPPTKRGA